VELLQLLQREASGHRLLKHHVLLLLPLQVGFQAPIQLRFHQVLKQVRVHFALAITLFMA
jgi:hypothetical protein